MAEATPGTLVKLRALHPLSVAECPLELLEVERTPGTDVVSREDREVTHAPHVSDSVIDRVFCRTVAHHVLPVVRHGDAVDQLGARRLHRPCVRRGVVDVAGQKERNLPVHSRGQASGCRSRKRREERTVVGTVRARRTVDIHRH